MSTLHEICHTVVRWLNETQPQNPNWLPDTWTTFNYVVQVHGIAPLLYEKIARADWSEAPVKEWLSQQYRFNAQRLEKLQAELKEILALFHRQNVPVMPLKGSILATTVYETPARRPMADLDLLIQPQNVTRSTALLIQLGYEPTVVHWKHTEFIKPDNRRVISDEVEHPDNPRRVELHPHCRETFGGPTVDLTELLWANATQGTLLGEQAVLPTPGALCLHLLVHATYHLWQGKGRLIHLVDLAQLISPTGKKNRNSIFLKNRVSVPELQLLLKAIDARFTYPALAMLHKYFPAVVDDSLLASQQAQLSPKFRQWIASWDLVNTSCLNPEPPGPYLFKALKFSQGRPQEIAQALRFALWPSLDEIVLDHPRLVQSNMPWLAYFLLPVDWVRRNMKKR